MELFDSQNKRRSKSKFSKKIIEFFNFEKYMDGNSLGEMIKELEDLYLKCSDHLDEKYIDELLSSDPNKTYSCMWEILIANEMLNYPGLLIESHTNYGPDWKIQLSNSTKYYIEATMAHIPTIDNSEICGIIKNMKVERVSSSGEQLVDEIKSRITNSIYSKIEKHSKIFEKNVSQDIGYILAISYGGIPLYATCDLHEAIKTIIPIGEMTLHVDHLNKIISAPYFKYKNEFKKPSSNSMISTNIFLNEDNSWVSAIMFSKIEPCFLLKSAEKIPGINWKGKRNDFVIIHNPLAKYPLQENIFFCETEITLEDSQLLIKGTNIFPSLIYPNPFVDSTNDEVRELNNDN